MTGSKINVGFFTCDAKFSLHERNQNKEFIFISMTMIGNENVASSGQTVSSLLYEVCKNYLKGSDF